MLYFEGFNSTKIQKKSNRQRQQAFGFPMPCGNTILLAARMRPLGIASYEDKIVQLAVKKILEAIYEPRFLNCMYGFRPNRGCHDAIKEVHRQLQNEWINYVVDADIRVITS